MKYLLILAAALLVLAALLSLVPGFRFSIILCVAFASLSLLFHYFLKHPTPANAIASKVLLIILAVGVVAAGITGAFILRSAHPSGNPSCRYIIVLGAGVNGTEPSRSLSERLQAAYDYLSANPESVAVLTGGQGKGEDITEAACMYRELTELGISPHRLYLEERSTSTIENLRYSLDLLEEELGFHPGKVGIVSSEYHLRRAKLFAKSLGVVAEGIPAKTTLLPLRLNYYLREIAAVWKYHIFGP